MTQILRILKCPVYLDLYHDLCLVMSSIQIEDLFVHVYNNTPDDQYSLYVEIEEIEEYDEN